MRTVPPQSDMVYGPQNVFTQGLEGKGALGGADSSLDNSWSLDHALPMASDVREVWGWERDRQHEVVSPPL